MYKLWAVAKRELLELSKSPGALLWMVALPIGLIALVGQIFSGSSGSDTSLSVNIAVVREDSGQAAKQLTEDLRQVPVFRVAETNLDKARDLVNTKRTFSAYVYIPANFSENLQNRQTSQLDAVIDPSDTTRYQMVRGMLLNVINRYNTQALLQAVASAQSQRDGQNSAQVLSQAELNQLSLQQKPVLNLNAESAGAVNSNSFDQVAPGYATMFVIFGLNAVAMTLIDERQRGTLRRIATLPVSKWSYMGGKMLAQFILSLFQVGVMLAFAKIAFNININLTNLPGIFLLTVGVSFAATGLGMLIATLCKGANQVRPVVTLVALVGSALGGSWFPLFLMPQWVQTVSKVTVNSWAMQGFNDLMIFNAQLSQVFLNIAVLLVYGTVCLLLATRFFKFQNV